MSYERMHGNGKCDCYQSFDRQGRDVTMTCSALIDPKRDHTCKEQIKRNKRQERLERKARREDGPEYDFWKGMRK